MSRSSAVLTTQGNGCLSLVRKFQDALDGGVAVEGDDDQPGPGEAGGGQDPAMRGIAVDGGFGAARPLRLLETAEVGLEGEVRYLRRLERGRDETPHPSASAQHDVSVERSARRPDGGLGCSRAGARLPDQTLDEPAVLDQEGRQPHGQRNGNEDRLTDCGRQQAAVHGQGHQQQAEFAAVGKDDGDAQRDCGGPAQDEPDDEADKALAEDKDQAPGEDRAGETAISRRSIAMPTVTKNRPTRMSRNGRNRPRRDAGKSLPPIIMPAMNAPIGKARPARWAK